MNELTIKKLGQLPVYEAACKAIEEAKATDEAKDIVDKAEAMRAYARQAKNKQLEVDAAEIRMRAERKLGIILTQQKKSEGLNKGAAAGGKRKGLRGAILEPRSNTPTLASAGIDKKLSSGAQKLAAIPEEKFESMVNDWRGRVIKETERVTTNLLREGERAQRDKNLKPPSLPEGAFDVILADPPWRYDFAETENRKIENQYPTMPTDEIAALEVPAADNAVLFLWAPAPKLKEALAVMESWGFEYKTSAVWDKVTMGTGYWFRSHHEYLLLGTIGEFPPPSPENRFKSIIKAVRDKKKHSKKPQEIYRIIEKMCPDRSYLELFARQTRDGWTSWGNEV